MCNWVPKPDQTPVNAAAAGMRRGLLWLFGLVSEKLTSNVDEVKGPRWSVLSFAAAPHPHPPRAWFQS